MSITIRPVAEDELAEWARALDIGFIRVPNQEMTAWWQPLLPVQRFTGAFDGERCVGTFRTFARDLVVPGGEAVPADAISSVSVTPTHSRRGLLTRMMTADLAAAKERGDVVAILVAAAWQIYGRFGFGAATATRDLLLDTARARVRPELVGPRPSGIEIVDPEEYRRLGPECHRRMMPELPGAISRTDHWWSVSTGELPPHPHTNEHKKSFFAVHRDGAGQPDGLLSYTVEERWADGAPASKLVVKDLLGADRGVLAELWRFVLGVEWVTEVVAENRGPDDLLPLLLTNARAVRVRESADFMWLRVLDVPRALETRSYPPVDARVVLHVDDELAGGTFELRVSGGVGECRPTGAEPDVTLSAGALGSLYLGGESAERLARAGDSVVEHKASAIALLDALLRSPTRPWNPDGF